MNETGQKIMQGTKRDFQLDVFNTRQANAEKNKEVDKVQQKSCD